MEREYDMPLGQGGTAPETCPNCAGDLKRVFLCHFSHDELRSTSYVAPIGGKGIQVKDHGRVFDMGMGAWYSSWSERKRLMKQKGLQEWGPTREV